MELLSEREKEVLSYICVGYTNGEIADKMFITRHTVKAHIASIIRKFSVRNRTEIAYIAGKKNLV